MINLKLITKLSNQQSSHQNKSVNLLDNDTEWLLNKKQEEINCQNQMKLFLLIPVLLKEILMKFIILRKQKLLKKKNKSRQRQKKSVFQSKDKQGLIDLKN